MPVDLCFVYTQRKQAGNAWLSGAEALIFYNVNVCMQSTMKRNYELCVSRSLDLMSKYAVPVYGESAMLQQAGAANRSAV